MFQACSPIATDLISYFFCSIDRTGYIQPGTESRGDLQVLGAQQDETGEAPFFTVAVIADDNNARHAVNHGRTHAFGAR